MEKKIAGLLGAVASLGAFSAAQAAPAPTDVLQANSYAELLQPISDASAKLQALDEAPPPTMTRENVQLAQYHHHHHHHHHHAYQRRYVPRVVVVPRYRRHHHHHHHHHNMY
ncbi:hypothetical protein UP10_27725 [Bradyrhizobium sp. LTSPM299]|uniref:hypothetical protein n=1 Tax=Bradyrhizobium sp. LTSPM299 TaxID=1619233 RepID=UPI0005CB6618|nr:hypothetical protein [Bradyrhizobium sp. LTSPM299]KJC57639.1 hypothetical protein UP10_27725 [Bradyrhizobium sp. LTSPM299]